MCTWLCSEQVLNPKFGASSSKKTCPRLNSAKPSCSFVLHTRFDFAAVTCARLFGYNFARLFGYLASADLTVRRRLRFHVGKVLHPPYLLVSTHTRLSPVSYHLVSRFLTPTFPHCSLTHPVVHVWSLHCIALQRTSGSRPLFPKKSKKWRKIF